MLSFLVYRSPEMLLSLYIRYQSKLEPEQYIIKSVLIQYNRATTIRANSI